MVPVRARTGAIVRAHQRIVRVRGISCSSTRFLYTLPR
jgi:hypothetical protein